MKRTIVDLKKLTPEILTLLVEKYPDGYDDHSIITFRNSKNQTVEAVEVRTTEAIYLVKVSSSLEMSMANFNEDDYEISTFQDPIIEMPSKNKLDEEE